MRYFWYNSPSKAHPLPVVMTPRKPSKYRIDYIIYLKTIRNGNDNIQQLIICQYFRETVIDQLMNGIT